MKKTHTGSKNCYPMGKGVNGPSKPTAGGNMHKMSGKGAKMPAHATHGGISKRKS